MQPHNYILSLIRDNKDWVNLLEEKAKKEAIPIMDAVSINFLMQIVRIKKPQYILEIGTAIGYSALRMIEAYPQTHIVTIERDKKRKKEAEYFIQLFNQEDKIDVMYGDALCIMEKLTNDHRTFDLIFIDAAKSQYKNFFEQGISLLSDNGIIVTDNILFKGYVYNDHSHSRYQKLAKKIDTFNNWLANHPLFETAFLPIGDGIALSLKKN